MSINFSVGHIVRTFPSVSDGSFNVGQIIGFEDHRLVVIDYALKSVIGLDAPDMVWSRFKVEMYGMNGKNGFSHIGDKVTVYGYQGAWTVEKFGQNPRSTEGEWCACLVHEDGKRRLFWPAHQLMKV